jgi:gliding motility-associated-like protein
MEIWDRWGVKMFETTDTEKCWDGKNMKGHPVKEGTYFYIAKFGEIIIKGNVAVLR